METVELVIVVLGALLALLVAGWVAMRIQADRTNTQIALAETKVKHERWLERVKKSNDPTSVVPDVGSSVVVHTIDARSIRGFVIKCGPMHLELDGVEYLSGGHPQRVGGTARIPITNVGWVQDLTKPLDEVTE